MKNDRILKIQQQGQGKRIMVGGRRKAAETLVIMYINSFSPQARL